MRLPDQDYLCQVSSYLATGISNVPTPDYEEPRKSDDRLITSLPVTKERFDRIIDFINRANRGICFNFSRQNCVRFIQVVLGIGGINMSIRTTAHELMAGVLPRLSDIPGIGKQVSAVVTKIGCVAASALDAVSTVLGFVTPYHLKKLGEFAVWAATEVLRRIDAVFWNALGLCVLGASKSIVPDSQMSNTSVPEVETFHHVLNWSDFFTPDAMPTYYVTKLKEWMQRQKTALLFRKPEYGFCCFDPDKAALQSPLM